MGIWRWNKLMTSVNNAITLQDFSRDSSISSLCLNKFGHLILIKDKIVIVWNISQIIETWQKAILLLPLLEGSSGHKTRKPKIVKCVCVWNTCDFLSPVKLLKFSFSSFSRFFLFWSHIYSAKSERSFCFLFSQFLNWKHPQFCI